VSKRCRRSNHNHNPAGIALQIVLNAFDFARRQRLSEPNHPGPHQRTAFGTSRDAISLLLLLLLENAARAFGNENVSVNLHHLRLRKSTAFVQIVHVLRDEQKFICALRQIGNRLMRGIWLCIANTVAPLAIPLPNQFRISSESFGCRQLYRVQIAPVAIFSAKRWNPAFSRNTRTGNNENTPNLRSTSSGDFQVGCYRLSPSMGQLMLPLPCRLARLAR